MGKKAAKKSEVSKVTEDRTGDVDSQNKHKLAKQTETLEKVPCEQELQSFMRQITDLILNELPKAEGTLLNDYTETEFILIDGDSLFITCASDLTLQQGQNLHFFFLVECFLMDLTSKGAKCIIVFFQDAEYLYQRNPYLLSLRTALILHLTNNTDITVRIEFSNCLDDSWQDFLRNNFSYCLIISDEGLNQWQTDFLHIFIIHALFKGISVVLTSGQESDAVRMYGYHIHSGQSYRQFFKQHKAKIKQYLKILLEPLKKSSTEELLSSCRCTKTMEQKIAYKMSLIRKGEKDIRHIVCIVSASLVLDMHSKELQTTAKKQRRKLLTLQEAADLIRMYCLSVAFLHHLPLSQRAQVRLIGNSWNEGSSVLIQKHKHCEFHVLKYLAHETSLNVDFSTVPDLSDNLVWKNIAHYYETEKDPECDLYIGSSIGQDYEYLWESVSTLSTGVDVGDFFPLRTSSKCFLTTTCSPSEGKESKVAVPNQGLIPVACAIVDEFAGDILSDLPFLKIDDPAVILLKKQKKVKERLSWYSRRPLFDDYPGTGVAENLWTLQIYPELQASQCIYEPLQELASSKTIDKEEDNSKMYRTDVKKSKKIRDEKKSKMANMKACFDVWKEHCDDEAFSFQAQSCKDLNLAVEVMRRIHSLIANYQDYLKKVDYKEIVNYLRHLGFENLIVTSEHPKVSGKKGDDFLKKNNSVYAVGIGSARFQLQYMSQYLIRERRNDPDPRVHFIPDTWQREILDIVDNNESAVIVAPPSSGKSCASYCCMEKILRDCDDGVVVYVAPTQAVVNQVEATVHSRFNKTFPGGLALCGVLSQAYRRAVLNCKVCYHGGHVRSEVWEHLLLMIQCPFLVLSATINNPEHLAEWLQKVKRYWKECAKTAVVSNSGSYATASQTNNREGAKELYRVKLVVHKERYNDLEKHVCSLKDDDFSINHYHPYASLTADHIMKYGFPEDLFLSPQETVELYDTMVKVWRNWPREHKLNPEEYVYFKDKTVITMRDVRYYEEELKYELQMWIEHNHKKEMSGRAGQRGHHLLGNVFFYNISLSKIGTLMKSNRSQIKGQFLPRISMILRLMLFASEASDKAGAREKVLSLLKNSLLSFEQPQIQNILKLYFLFSLQFLVREVILHMLGITAANIPVLYSKKYDKQGRRMPLNAYVLDFYRHGSLAAMSQENGLHEGEAYRLLKDFALNIQSISVSLREFCGSEDRNVVWAFQQLSNHYWKKLEMVQKN
ncbi:probable ATP-dependent RNA helicase DDX60 [Rhineura floridana]|uniref:probable ATP-dependent RNA helicase DDX60 n=1 Tax=Rhineura floridana TaxID=261503 RepID=UPI002AC89037|nr:probable ATP-dependent RNA helicase DDX60 [Rhineura floridana]